MSPRRQPEIVQETMFMSSPGTGAEYPVVPSRDSEVSINILENNLHTQNVLRLFSQISQKTGFQKANYTDSREDFSERYEKNLNKVVKGSNSNRTRLEHEAKREFAAAFGLSLLTSDDLMTEEEVKALARSSYKEFRNEYAGAENRIKREKELTRLVIREVILVSDVQPTAKSTGQQKPKEELRYLSNQEKLKVLRDDPEAAFLPTTNSEKNRALTLLDYLHKPAYPLGSTHHFDEVFLHQQNEFGVSEGVKTMRSVTFELGDYFLNAIESIQVLRELELAVRKCPNPKVSFFDEGLHTTHYRGVLALIRFIDQRAFRETGHPPSRTRFNIFRTHSDRGPQDEPGKNKTVEDPYMSKHHRKVVAEYIEKRIGSLTIGETRKIFADAIPDQQNRAAFWEARLWATQPRRFMWRTGARILELANGTDEIKQPA